MRDIMTDEERGIVEKASGILSNEGDKGFYFVDEAQKFWDAEKMIDRALGAVKNE